MSGSRFAVLVAAAVVVIPLGGLSMPVQAGPGNPTEGDGFVACWKCQPCGRPGTGERETNLLTGPLAGWHDCEVECGVNPTDCGCGETNCSGSDIPEAIAAAKLIDDILGRPEINVVRVGTVQMKVGDITSGSLYADAGFVEDLTALKQTSCALNTLVALVRRVTSEPSSLMGILLNN